jgi:hypoxanthine phosphoribosyltransferase
VNNGTISLMNKDTIKLHDRKFTLSLSPPEIQREVSRIAERINHDLESENPVFIGILNGSFMFTSDLLKKITINCQVTFLKLSSYRGLSSTGKMNELIGLDIDLKGRSLVIVEDIVDTGTTLEYIISRLKLKSPKQIRIATLLLKPDTFKGNIHIDYVGFEIPNDFIVGYGLDYNQQGRNLEGIYKILY